LACLRERRKPRRASVSFEALGREIMTKYSLLSASALISILTVSSVSAQRTAAPPSQPVSTPQVNATLPTSKIALIYSDAFLDPKTGIAKFNVVLGTLNREFQKQKDDLTQMQQRSQQLQDEVTKLQQAPAGTPIDQKSLQTKIDQLDQLKKDFQRKGEDAQAAYNKRRQDVFAPLQEEIAKALEIFAKAHNITVIIDGTQVPLVYASASIDITRVFINEFNSKNPATALVKPPG
jgi:Skp family chaperone for outer membrane proteins